MVGAGAIGGTLAGHLAGAGNDVVAIDGWAAHVATINAHGLRVEGVRGDKRFALRAVSYEEARNLTDIADAVFICVKSNDTERAADLVKHLVGPSSMIASTQNGLNEERLCEIFGAPQVMGAVTEMGGSLPEPGLVLESRKDGGFLVGELDGSRTRRVDQLAELMSACAPTHVSSNIVGILWSKLLWNCMLNGGSAVTGLGQGRMIVDDELRGMLIEVGREVLRTGQAAGVRFERLEMMGIDPASMCSPDASVAAPAETAIVARYRTQLDKTTSMSQDVQKGRPTEIDYLNGYVVAKASGLSITTPLNERLVHLVHEIEMRRLQPNPEHLKQMARWRSAR